MTKTYAQNRPDLAQIRPVIEVFHGYEIVDPYRWMEDLKSPDTINWMKAQSDYARNYLDQLPLRAELLERLSQVSNAGTNITDIQRRGKRLFYFKLDPGDNDRKIYVWDDLTQTERSLIDPEAISSGRVHYSITSFSVSPDGRFLSYIISGGGAEFGDLYVIETETGLPTGDRIEHTRWIAGTWLPNNHAFAYMCFQTLAPDAPPTDIYKKTRVYLHQMGANSTEDRPIFGCDVHPDIHFEDELIPFLDISIGSKYALAIVNSGVSPNSAFYYASINDLDKMPIPWKLAAGLEENVSFAAIHNEQLYLLTYRDTPRYKLVRTDLANISLSSAEIVFPPSEAVVENFVTAKDALYIQTLAGGLRRLYQIDYASSLIQPISLPYEGSAQIAVGDCLENGLLFTINSWTKSPALYRYDPIDRITVNTGLIPPIPVDMSEIEVSNFNVPSHDGVLIPMVVLSKHGCKRDGKNPTLLDGYGAYSIEITSPKFLTLYLPWLERGGILVFAGVRGGGEYGEEWHLAGKESTKSNTWNDFIACAEYLVQNRYTSPDHLAGQGTSAGGITIGNAIAERPDLFATAIINVGCNNALRMETTPNGVPNIAEFGSFQTEEGFKALLAMDAYHKIKDGVRYPAILLTHGINDPRVEPWFSAKMAARLLRASASDRPILLRLDYDAGHGIGSTKTQLNERLADTYAFLFHQLGNID